ncbi:MAG: hypothetical protein H5T65_08180 [Chloroflexi bacterium]|nr:hypothetical protein [Chloroflexota bacterium]
MEGMLILIAGCLLLILYLSVRLWIAEHDRNLLLENVSIAPVDYGAGWGALLAFLMMMAMLGIAVLWLVGAI